MDDWESLNRKGNRALAEGKHEVALECFNDALELDEDNHVLYSNRCVAHIKLEKWKLAVEDAENVIKLKPDWVTGHARLGAAAFGNHDFIGARKSFEKAAKIDPDNRSYTEQAIKCTEMALQAASMGRKNPLEEPSALEELVEKIFEPEMMEKLKNHDRTQIYFRDREFLDLLTEIRADPQLLKPRITEPRFMEIAAIVSGVEIPSAFTVKDAKRGELTISSDEEDSNESESDNEKPLAQAEPIRLPIKVEKGKRKTLAEEAAEARNAAPKFTQEELRAKVAKSMGVSTEDMLSMMNKTHKDDSGEVRQPTANVDIEFVEGVPEPSDLLLTTRGPAHDDDDADNAADLKNVKAPSKCAKPISKPTEPAEPDVELPAFPSDVNERAQLAIKLKSQATEAYKARHFRGALKLYLAGAELDPENMVYLLNAGAAHLELKEYDLCVERCTDAAAIGRKFDSDNTAMIAKAYGRAGKALMSKEDYQAAAKAYSEALTTDRKAEYLNHKNECAKKGRKAVEAAYKDPLKAQSAKARGNELVKSKDYPGAVREYADAIARDPDNVHLVSRVLSNRANAYTLMNENVLALQDCDECIRLDPSWIKGYLRRGHLLNLLEQWDDARDVYIKALEIDPHSYNARTGLEKAERGIALIGKTHKETAMEAMKDPRIQELWETSRSLIKDMTDPDIGMEAPHVKKQLEDPVVRRNLEQLRKAGLLQ